MELTTALITLNLILLAGLVVMSFLHQRHLRRQLNAARLDLRKHVQEAGQKTRSQVLALHKEMRAEEEQRAETQKALLLDCLIGPRAFLNPAVNLRLAREDLHVILALPKVGGSTVTEVLKKAGIGGRIDHPHGISTSHLRKKLGDYLEPPHRPTYVDYASTRLQVEMHETVRQLFPELARPPRTWFYLGTREPVSQLLSLCFQRLRDHEYPGDDVLLAELHAQARDPEWQQSFDAWFDRECLETIGFDAFAGEFDHGQGWSIYPPDPSSPMRVLVFRLEDIEKIPQALGHMHGMSPKSFTMVREASSNDSGHGEAYDRLRGVFRLPLPLLEQIYSSRYCRHFYRRAELERFMQKWAEGPATSLPDIDPKLLELREQSSLKSQAAATESAETRA